MVPVVDEQDTRLVLDRELRRASGPLEQDPGGTEVDICYNERRAMLGVDAHGWCQSKGEVLAAIVARKAEIVDP